MSDDLRRGLESAQRLGSAAQVLAGLVAASGVVMAIAVSVYLNDAWPEAYAGTDDMEAIEWFQLVDILLLFLSFFVVGAWIYRAHANLKLTDLPDTGYSPGWAVGWFAIPIASLFKPFQAMKALWVASHGLSYEAEPSAPGVMWVWWLCWIFSSLFGFGETLGMINVLVFVSTSVSAVCLIVIIRDINAAQPNMSMAEVFE
ncbi:hypothetical protein MACH24_25760 [Erythrobacter sp. Dej080120_24]|uniref:DUF4328 domain-containing protein n=1 Tax=Erythrobacter sp. Dej080120_24 TaxID=3024837 RepID=UPI002922DB81|nr:hypothetical protein MACH24_25760 [Erythrobacter sp. Dej080120_24]